MSMSSDTHFDPDMQQMFYFVREHFQNTPFKEGFASNIKLLLEFTDGQICVDGSNKYNVSHCDTCELDIKPEYRLKCFKFGSINQK